MKYKQTHGGKGSARRNADDKAYADNWDKIFNKEKQVYAELIQSRKGERPPTPPNEPNGD
jgi:hypothetical protein